MINVKLTRDEQSQNNNHNNPVDSVLNAVHTKANRVD